MPTWWKKKTKKTPQTGGKASIPPSVAPKTGAIPTTGPFPRNSSIKQVIQRMLSTAAGTDRVVGGSDNRPGKIRVNDRKYSDALRENLKRGVTPDALPKIPYKSSSDARLNRQRSLAQSPMFLEAIRSRLTGNRLGSPNVTKEDVRRAGHIFGLSEALKLDAKAGKARTEAAKERLRQELEGELSFWKKAIKKTTDTARGVGGKLSDAVTGVLDRLTKDKIQRGLAGLGIEAKGHAPTAPIAARGFDRATPRQQRTMVGVQSSNVASVGWEPDNQDKKRHQPNDLGELFIQFRNGWMYRYAACPRWVYDGMLRASSKGKFVWAVIRRGLYPDGVPYGSVAVEGYERIK